MAKHHVEAACNDARDEGARSGAEADEGFDVLAREIAWLEQLSVLTQAEAAQARACMEQHKPEASLAVGDTHT